MTDAPPTLRALREALSRGEWTVREAVAAQFARMADDHPAVVARHVRSADEALARGVTGNGLLAAAVLAHKDVFDLPGRAPGLGRPSSPPDHAACLASPASDFPGHVSDLSGQAPGLPSHGSSPPAQPPRRMAEALRRLEAAGAINAAALVMAELACGATAENPHLPPLPNPLDPSAAVGGSSSGSAVAVASGYCHASLGTDTFGSVRIPAATCGLFGFKPSHGRVPVEGVAPLAPSLDTVGILSRDAEDAWLVHRALIAPTAAASAEAGGAAEAAAPARRRVACLIEDAALDAAVGDALADFADGLRAFARLEPVRAVPSPRLKDYAQVLLHAEAFATHRSGLARAWPTFAPATRSVLAPGAVLPGDWRRIALERRAACHAQFLDEVMGGTDFLLIPALPREVPDMAVVRRDSPAFEPRQLLALHAWMPWASYLGMPAAVLPIARDGRGRPIAAQIVAPRGRDEDLLAFCRAIQRRVPPPVFSHAPGPSGRRLHRFH